MEEGNVIGTETLIRRVRSAQVVMTLTQRAGDTPVGVILTEVALGGGEVITSFILDELVGEKVGNVVPVTRRQLRALGLGPGTLL
jgi:hypothetical protein